MQEDDFAGHRLVASTPDHPAPGSGGGVNVAQITSSLLVAAGPAAAAAVPRGSGTPGGPAGETCRAVGAAAAAGHYREHTVPASSFGKPGMQHRATCNSAYMSSSSSPRSTGPVGHPLAVAAAASAGDPSSSATDPSTPPTPPTAAVAVQTFAANASKAGLAHAEFMAIAATASSAVEGANPAHRSSNSSSSAVRAGTKGPLHSTLFTGSSAASSSMIKANSPHQAMGYSAAGTVAPLRTSDYGTYNNTGRKYGSSTTDQWVCMAGVRLQLQAKAAMAVLLQNLQQGRRL